MDETRASQTKIRAELTCKGCGASWLHTSGKTTTKCPFCGKFKDARDRREEAKLYDADQKRKGKMKEWSKDNQRERGKRSRELLRKRVFFKISGSIEPKCSRCGCDDPRLLEINHKNGGGSKDYNGGLTSHRFHYDIAMGKRSTDDLELLCRPCNALHYLEQKYGPLPMRVTWNGCKAD